MAIKDYVNPFTEKPQNSQKHQNVSITGSNYISSNPKFQRRGLPGKDHRQSVHLSVGPLALPAAVVAACKAPHKHFRHMLYLLHDVMINYINSKFNTISIERKIEIFI